MMKSLYDSKLKYNCSYYEMKRENKSDLLIVFLGTSDFIITNNYWGVIAYGKRDFDFDKNISIYTYLQVNNHICKSEIERLIKKYEIKRLNITNIKIIESEKLKDEEND